MKATQLEAILKESAEEARRALESAVWFEVLIVSVAAISIAMQRLRKADAPMHLTDFHEKGEMKIGTAIDIVGRNYSEQIPGLRVKLQQGKKARNRIVHDVGPLMGRQALVEGIRRLSTPPEVRAVLDEIFHSSTNKIREMQKEMDGHLQVAHGLFDKALGEADGIVKAKVQL